MSLTIAYMTCRKEPRFSWFWNSLQRELLDDPMAAHVKLVIVDFWAENRLGEFPQEFMHISPKPSVWQGKFRLTSKDYFAASNARNTAICVAPDGWLAFVDDLSWLAPGWLRCVREHQAKNSYVVGGSYRKVFDLEVNQDGSLRAYRDHHKGWDQRWHAGSDVGAVRINGGAIFGCNLAAPVEAFLATNGYDEDCDSMGFEDCIWGKMAEFQGWPTMLDRRMMTYEDEMDHYSGEVFHRIIKANPPIPDASHVMLNMVLHGGRHKAPNYFGPGGIRAVRERVLAGEPFPEFASPQHHWPDGQPLVEM